MWQKIIVLAVALMVMSCAQANTGPVIITDQLTRDKVIMPVNDHMANVHPRAMVKYGDLIHTKDGYTITANWVDGTESGAWVYSLNDTFQVYSVK